MRFLALILLLCGLVLAQQRGQPEVVAFLPEDGPIAFSSDGRFLVGLFPYNDDGRQTVQRQRLEQGSLTFDTGYVLPKGKYLLGVSPDTRLLAVSGLSECVRTTSGYTVGSVGRLELLEFPSGRVVNTLADRSLCGLTYPVFSPNQTLLAVPNRLGYVQLRNVTGQLVRSFQVAGEIDTVSFSRDGQLLAVCGERLEVYRVKDGKRILRLETDLPNAASTCRDAPAVFTPDGAGLLLVDRSKPAGWWNLTTGRLVRRFEPRLGQPPERVAISGDGRFVLTVDKGQGMTVYASSGRMLFQTAKGGYGLVVTPSLEYFATNNLPKLWRLR